MLSCAQEAVIIIEAITRLDLGFETMARVLQVLSASRDPSGRGQGSHPTILAAWEDLHPESHSLIFFFGN